MSGINNNSNVLSAKDANLPLQVEAATKDVKSMEYHRQVLQSKMAEEKYELVITNSSKPSSISLSPKMAQPRIQVHQDSAPVSSLPPSRAGLPATAGISARPHFLDRRLGHNADMGYPSRNKQQYTSPSDNIMSPCSAKLSAFRGKQAGKVKPKSLFAQASSKRLEGDSLFGGSKTQ